MKSAAIILIAMTLAASLRAEPRDTHERLNAILWVQTSAEFKVLAESTYRQAWKQVEAILNKAKTGVDVPSAALEQPGSNVARLPYAVILDIDETVLDNSPMSGKLIETRSGYNLDNWTRWVEGESAAFIPGSESFINAARAANIEIVFITNRTKKEEASTIRDLKPIAVLDEQILAAEEKADSTAQPWPSEKLSRREFVAKKYWIIAMIGDDLADFIPNIRTMSPSQRISEAQKYQEKFGEQWFLLPNPIYGSWEAVLYDRKDPDKKQLEDKLKSVKSY